jgi:hypothetical protein
MTGRRRAPDRPNQLSAAAAIEERLGIVTPIDPR